MLRLKQIWSAYGNAESAWGLLTSDWLKPWLAPLAVGAVTMLAGLFSSVPLPYLIATACVASAGAMGALVRAEELWMRINPSGKLVFEYPLLGVDTDNPVDPKSFKVMQLGFTVSNQAYYPIFFRVDSIFSQMGGRVPVRREYNFKPAVETPANGTGWFRDELIELDLPIADGFIEGELSIRVLYWRNERRQFVLERRLRLTAKVHTDSGQISLSWANI